jgi:1-acyl-sn-glycerol-3-phosphate acyltransferase
MGKLCFFILRLFGWKIDKTAPANVKKAVIVMGPHTSNWDFVVGKMAFAHYKVNAKFLIKKDLFFFPLGIILKAMGGIPVDRKKSSNVTKQAVDLFKANDTFFLVFTPEGTRSYQPNWKKGFYFIAEQAKVPIYIAYMDYKTKTGGFHSLFQPTGDVDADIITIKRILSKFTGRIPENGIKAPEDE